MRNNQMSGRIGGLLALFIAGALQAWGGSVFECDFNALSDGAIDGQPGWDVYDKVPDSSAFSVVAEVGTSEGAEDKALLVRRSAVPIRCVSDQPVRWLRKQHLQVEFDFRLVVPSDPVRQNSPVLIAGIGNTVLNDKARWEVRIDAAPDGRWILTAALPDEASVEIPAERLAFTKGEVSDISDWMRCVVEIQKLSEVDSFIASVRILDRRGETVTSVSCTDTNKDAVTKAIWNLSRLHAGFLTSRDTHGMACIDRLRVSAEP